jgi:hypothetical protein
MHTIIKLPVLHIQDEFVSRTDGRHFSGGKVTDGSIGYVNSILIDCEGNCFEVERVISGNRISIWDSIKQFQLMYHLTPVLRRDPYKIPLQELKEMLIILVKKHPRKYRSFLPVSMIVEDIGKMTTYEELVRYFP